MSSTVPDRRRWGIDSAAAACRGMGVLALARWGAWWPLASQAGAQALPPPATASAASPLLLGVLPNLSPRVIATTYQPLRDFLRQALQREVQVVTAPDFASYDQRCREGQYALFVTSPNLGALLLADGLARVLAIAEPGVSALAVAPRTAAGTAPALANVLQHLRGRHLALANPASLVSLRGLAWLRERGLQAGTDFHTVQVANEDSLARWLDGGDAPLALMSQGELRQLSPDRQATLAVVHTVAQLPGFMVGVPATTPAAEADAFLQALQQFMASAESAAFRRAGPQALRPLTAADRAALQPDLEATRRALAALRG